MSKPKEPTVLIELSEQELDVLRMLFWHGMQTLSADKFPPDTYVGLKLSAADAKMDRLKWIAGQS